MNTWEKIVRYLIAMMFAAPLLVACAPLVKETASQVEVNKAVVRRALQAIEQGDLETLNKVYDPKGPVHTSRGIQLQGGPYMDLKGSCPMCVVLIPRRIAIDLVLGEGDLVTVRSTWTGTYTGDFRGVPISGKDIEVSYTNIMRVVDGRIAENWVSVNQLALAEQLGMRLCPAEASK